MFAQEELANPPVAILGKRATQDDGYAMNLEEDDLRILSTPLNNHKKKFASEFNSSDSRMRSTARIFAGIDLSDHKNSNAKTIYITQSEIRSNPLYQDYTLRTKAQRKVLKESEFQKRRFDRKAELEHEFTSNQEQRAKEEIDKSFILQYELFEKERLLEVTEPTEDLMKELRQEFENKFKETELPAIEQELKQARVHYVESNLLDYDERELRKYQLDNEELDPVLESKSGYSDSEILFIKRLKESDLNFQAERVWLLEDNVVKFNRRHGYKIAQDYEAELRENPLEEPGIFFNLYEDLYHSELLKYLISPLDQFYKAKIQKQNEVQEVAPWINPSTILKLDEETKRRHYWVPFVGKKYESESIISFMQTILTNIPNNSTREICNISSFLIYFAKVVLFANDEAALAKCFSKSMNKDSAHFFRYLLERNTDHFQFDRAYTPEPFMRGRSAEFSLLRYTTVQYEVTKTLKELFEKAAFQKLEYHVHLKLSKKSVAKRSLKYPPIAGQKPFKETEYAKFLDAHTFTSTILPDLHDQLSLDYKLFSQEREEYRQEEKEKSVRGEAEKILEAGTEQDAFNVLRVNLNPELVRPATFLKLCSSVDDESSPNTTIIRCSPPSPLSEAAKNGAVYISGDRVSITKNDLMMTPVLVQEEEEEEKVQEKDTPAKASLIPTGDHLHFYFTSNHRRRAAPLGIKICSSFTNFVAKEGDNDNELLKELNDIEYELLNPRTHFFADDYEDFNKKRTYQVPLRVKDRLENMTARNFLKAIMDTKSPYIGLNTQINLINFDPDHDEVDIYYGINCRKFDSLEFSLLYSAVVYANALARKAFKTQIDDTRSKYQHEKVVQDLIRSLDKKR